MSDLNDEQLKALRKRFGEKKPSWLDVYPSAAAMVWGRVRPDVLVLLGEVDRQEAEILRLRKELLAMVKEKARLEQTVDELSGSLVVAESGVEADFARVKELEDLLWRSKKVALKDPDDDEAWQLAIDIVAALKED